MVRKVGEILAPDGDDDQPGEKDIDVFVARTPKVTTTTKKRNKQRGDDASKDWTDLFYDSGVNSNLSPCDTTADFIVEFVQKLIGEEFFKVTDHLNGRSLVVATACSGTEAPIMFLEILSIALRKRGFNFKIEHVFSIEIEPYKQTYIRRNFPGVVILRDITEVLRWSDHPEEKGLMTTAYGATYTLPPVSNIDLFVAGTSCTSFSTLNSQRSTDLKNDENESARTFSAYAKLVGYLKPKISISENVGGGPFEAMMGMLRNQGCLTGWALFDSKHFGIPQTRQRGYLVAINKEASQKAGIAEKYSDPMEWKSLLGTLKPKFGRDASTSIEQWMEKSDSKILRSQIELQGEARAFMDWTTCHSRHEDYRHAQRLGTGKPITDWRSTGVFRHPDHWVRDMKGFVERVHDYTDVSHLRGVVRGYDDRYISRNNDLSQNVYVQHDNTKGGIMSCLTPNGAMFNTARGSKITGDEALRLQGIDTAGLDLDGLTQTELRNFAGNAMTTTVVGAVTSFALLTFFNILDRGNDADIPIEDAVTMNFRGRETILDSCENIVVVQEPMTVRECIHLVEASAKYCYCEAQTDISQWEILKCKFCHHVSCSGCGVKPRHAYEPLSNFFDPTGAKGIMHRIYPSSVEFNVADRLPMKIILSELFASDNQMVAFLQRLGNEDVDHTQWAALRKTWLKCFLSTVKYQKPVRSFSWNFSWVSDFAKLELVLSDSNVAAFLYALPDRTLPVNSYLRKYLAKFPVARTVPLYGTADSDKSMFDCTWQVWLPKVQVVKAIVTYGGNLMPSYQNSIGIPDYKGDLVWSEVTIQVPGDADKVFRQICGVYIARPECQQAFNSAHVKKHTLESDRPLFLFFDHEASTGDWFKHGFVITDDPTRKEWGVYRRVIAAFDCSWEKPVARKLKDGYEFKNSTYEDIQSLQQAMSETITITSFGNWTMPQMVAIPMASSPRDDSSLVSYEKLDLSSPQLLTETDCKVFLTAFSCKALTDTTPCHWQIDCWTKVTRQNGIEFFKECYHLLARGVVQHGVVEAELPWIPGAEQATIASRCRDCAPEKPPMLWYLKQNGPRRHQAPMEDPQAAARFERLIKTAPPAIEEWAKFSKIDDYYQFEYRCLINPSALSHKAADLLDNTPRPDVPVMLSWRFIRGAFGKKILPTLPFVYSSTDDLKMSDPPRRFIAGKRLRNEQRKTLTWMVNQERFPPTFMEREVVETRQENLAFRLEGRACRMVKHRAGLLAAAVGYGKTVMTFALMSKQYIVDREWSRLPNLNGLIHAKATLVLVPAHLTLQWRDESCSFLGFDTKDDPRLIVLTTCQQIKALTVQEVVDAELVICNSSLFNGEGYLKVVAKNAGVVDLARSSSDRAKEAWYINANKERKENLLRLQQLLAREHDGSDEEARKNAIDEFTKFMKEKYMKNFAEAGANKPHIPSRRLRGAALARDLEKKKKKSTTAKNSRAKISTDEDSAEESFAGPAFESDCVLGLSSPSLQDFEWARVVTDEISYLVSTFIAAAIRELAAQSRWALSGTPNITDHLSASRIARCLGINLGVDDQETVRKDKHLTSAERFLSYGPDASPSWHAARFQVAQEFCDMFVRQDKRADTGKFNRVHSFIATKMATPQLACYLTIKSDVINKSFMMTRNMEARSAVQEELQNVYGKELDGRLRLTKAASFFPEHSRKTVPYTLKTCRDLRAIALSEIGVAKDHFRTQIELIRFLLPLPQVAEDPDMKTRYNNWRTQILAQQRYPDPDALLDLAQVLEAVELAPPKKRHELYFTVPLAPLGRRLYPAVDIMLNGRKLNGLLADCRRVLTQLHKTAVAIVHSRQEYRYYKAVVEIDRAGRSFPQGTLTCNNCNLPSTLSEAVIQGNCGHVLCAPCNALLEDGLCPIELCGGTSLHDQKYQAMSLYSPAGNFEADNVLEIAQTKAVVQASLPPSLQPSEADWAFWSKPYVIVDKLSAVRRIFWEHDDGFNKFIVFSPLPEYLQLAEAVISADGVPCINLKGRKSDIARILENFKNNRGMNYHPDPKRTRVPTSKANLPAPTPTPTPAPAASVQDTSPRLSMQKRNRSVSEDITEDAPPRKAARVASLIVQVPTPPLGLQKRKRSISGAITEDAPLLKVARVAPPIQLEGDSVDSDGVSDREKDSDDFYGFDDSDEDLYSVGDSEDERASASPVSSIADSINARYCAQDSPDEAAGLPELPVLLDSPEPDSFVVSGENADDIDPVDQSVHDWVIDSTITGGLESADVLDSADQLFDDCASSTETECSEIDPWMLVPLNEIEFDAAAASAGAYTMISGLGFADVLDPADQLIDDCISSTQTAYTAVDPSEFEVIKDIEANTSVASAGASFPDDYPVTCYVPPPPAVYPVIDPSELEVINDIEVNASAASAGVSHPDDRPVDWARVGKEAYQPPFEADLDPTARILFLDIADESAAGSNLTVVQHVIFMTPYHAEKTKYNAAMTQAIGRAIRQGQKNNVTVMIHHLLVQDTVEMDIAHDLMDDDFPGKANALPMLAKFKSNIGPTFYKK